MDAVLVERADRWVSGRYEDDSFAVIDGDQVVASVPADDRVGLCYVLWVDSGRTTWPRSHEQVPRVALHIQPTAVAEPGPEAGLQERLDWLVARKRAESPAPTKLQARLERIRNRRREVTG